MTNDEHRASPRPSIPSPEGEGKIVLRHATLADAPLLHAWDAKQHVIDASGDPDANGEWDWAYEIPRALSWRELLIAQGGRRPIGFIQIIDPLEEETHYWGECAANMRALDIWIGDEADLGRGYGTQMMRLAIAHCFADPNVTGILIDPLASNTRALRFYERMGFRFVERRTFLGVDDCAVYRLDRPDWDFPHRHSGRAERDPERRGSSS